MTLTNEQQAQLTIQMEVEAARHANQMQAEAKRNRLEAVRLAKETLIENARSKPIEESTVSAADITTFAEQLVAYIDA